MNNIIILGILINLLLIIHTSFVFSKTTFCYTTILGSYRSCESGNWTVFQEKDSIIKTYPDKIEVTNKKANVLQNKAFENISSSATIKTLQLNLAADVELHIEPLVFSNFKKLENLEINSASVLLDPDTFHGLDDLKYLKIQIANKTRQHFNDILKKHLNLQKLEFINHEDIDICNLINENNPVKILQLQYTGSSMEIITRQSLMCLKNLQHLTIAESNLTFIAPGTFGVLKKLKTISLISNVKLTHIPANVFNIKSLNIIDLSNNSINKIDDGAFKIDNNKLSLLNLSYNSLEIIGEGIFQNIKCAVVDLTHSEIVAVVDEAFNKSHVDTIYFYKNQFFDINIGKWGIDYYTTMIYLNYQISDFAIGSIESKNSIHQITSKTINPIGTKNLTDTCYLSKYDYFKICKNSDSLSLTSVKSLVIDIWQPMMLHINDYNIISIDDNAFYNLKIKILIITSKQEIFTINKDAFAGLQNLKVLKLNTKPIFFKTSPFYHLKSLNLLEISTTQSWIFYSMFSCELLTNISTLHSFSIIHHSTIDICHEKCKSKTFDIIRLRYAIGTFKILEPMVFSCLNKLEILDISNGSLEIIASQAFYGLENVYELTMTSNQITHINQDVFEPLKNLNTLILKKNKIQFIDDKAFNHKTLSLLDLSYNSIIHIKENTFFGVRCYVLDLSNNNIISIENNAFKNLNLDILYVYNNDKLEKNPSAWAVSNLKIETTCDIKDWMIEICKKHNSISSVKSSTDVTEYIFDILPWSVIDKVEINTNDIQSISKYAFKQSSLKNQLKTLIIYNDNDKYGIDLYPESFEGLTKLENLELNVGSVLIKNNLFSFLPSLKYLKIKPYELNNVYISQVIMKLKNLKTLEIIGNNSIGICQNLHSKNIPKSIIDIRYTTGFIHSLKANSFICLPQIEVLTITKTQLMRFEAGAFNLLNNLKYLNLSFNKITFISVNIFDNLKKLIDLVLNNNEINYIDDGAMMITGNENFQNFNLSYNKLEVIKKNTFYGVKCNKLDLSQNTIGHIDNGAFLNSKIEDLFLFNNTGIVEVNKAWGISESTYVHINVPTHEVMYCKLRTGKRIDCKHCEKSVKCILVSLRFG